MEGKFMASNIGEPTQHVSGNGASAQSNMGKPVIFLAPPTSVEQGSTTQLNGMLGWLARRFKLDIYGDSSLTRCATYEMKFYALMLAFIGLFDFIAWFLLWNMIFYNSGKQFGGWSLFALTLALIFATMVFLWERSWAIRDTDTRFFSKMTFFTVLGGTLRILVIAGAAFIQAQPLEDIAFNSAVQRRVHEQSVRAEAVLRLKNLLAAKAKSRGEGTVEERLYNQTDTTLTETRKLTDRALAARESAGNAVKSAEANLNRAIDANNRSDDNRYANWVSNARARLEEARRKYTLADKDFQEKQNLIQGQREDKDRDRQALIEKGKTAEQDIERVQNWVIRIRGDESGEKIDEDTAREDKWTYKDRDYDFFERLSVIDDLCAGRPARWVDATEEHRNLLAKEFNLADTQESDESRNSRAEIFRRWWWGVLGVAMFVPLMVFLFKPIMRPELRRYYSSRAQRREFNYDAEEAMGNSNNSPSANDSTII